MASNFPEVGGLLVELVDLSWFSNPTSSLWVLLPSISWCAVSLFEQCTTTGCQSVGVLFRCSSSVPLLV